MYNIQCCNCGKLWDDHYLRHELNPKLSRFKPGMWKFGCNRLVVLHCPQCPVDGTELPDAEYRKEATKRLAELLSHKDEDLLAVALQDFPR